MIKDKPIKGEPKTYSHEAYARMRAAGHSHECVPWLWAIGEIDRLRTQVLDLQLILNTDEGR